MDPGFCRDAFPAFAFGDQRVVHNDPYGPPLATTPAHDTDLQTVRIE